jgi:hypothetical protein
LESFIRSPTFATKKRLTPKPQKESVMKIFKTLTVLSATCLCAGSVFITSCSDDNNSKSSVSGSLGEITADHTRFGLGQPITFTCPVTWGENLAQGSGIYWTNPYGISGSPMTPEDGKKDLKTQFTYTPDQTGDATVKCTFLNIGVNLDNTLVKEFKFTVVPCDIRTSFWSDTQEEVRRDEPRLQSVASKPDLLSMQIPDEIGPSTTGKQRVVSYLFTTNKLSQVGEVVNYDAYVANRYFESVRILSRSFTKSMTSAFTAAPDYDPTGIVYDTLMKMGQDGTYIPTKDELDPLTTAILAGNLSFKYVLKNDITQVEIEIGKAYGSIVEGDMELFYTPIIPG